MDKIINKVIYKHIAIKHGVTKGTVEAILDSVSKMVAKTIKENPDKVSVKLDHIGNFLSHPLRREALRKKEEIYNREKYARRTQTG